MNQPADQRDPFCDMMNQAARDHEWKQIRAHELEQYIAELANRERDAAVTGARGPTSASAITAGLSSTNER